mmetsp:Transcript_28874/g.87358  ORF Transcript_28874/g.87358 Transcript_28874/m.87358 type:complete len:342 (-) Transcript_28874:360-1385(-)
MLLTSAAVGDLKMIRPVGSPVPRKSSLSPLSLGPKLMSTSINAKTSVAPKATTWAMPNKSLRPPSINGCRPPVATVDANGLLTAPRLPNISARRSWASWKLSPFSLLVVHTDNTTQACRAESNCASNADEAALALLTGTIPAYLSKAGPQTSEEKFIAPPRFLPFCLYCGKYSAQAGDQQNLCGASASVPAPTTTEKLAGRVFAWGFSVASAAYVMLERVVLYTYWAERFPKPQSSPGPKGSWPGGVTTPVTAMFVFPLAQALASGVPMPKSRGIPAPRSKSVSMKLIHERLPPCNTMIASASTCNTQGSLLREKGSPWTSEELPRCASDGCSQGKRRSTM